MSGTVLRYRLWLALLLLAVTGCLGNVPDLPSQPPPGPTIGPTATPLRLATPTLAPRPTLAPQSTTAPGQPTTAPAAPTPTAAAPAAPADLPNLEALRLAHEKVAEDMVSPLQVTHAGDGSNRLFAV